MKLKATVSTALLISLSICNTAWSTIFYPNQTYQVDFDLSASALINYEIIYLMYDFSSGPINPGESVQAHAWDDPSMEVTNFTLTNTSSDDYEMWGQNMYFAAGSAFNDSKGFFTFDNIKGIFNVKSVDVVLQRWNGFHWDSTDRLTLTDIYPVSSPVPEPATITLLGICFIGLFSLQLGHRKA